MGIREDTGYSEDDEAWRRNAEKRRAAGATQAAKSIARVADAMNADDTIPACEPTRAASGRPVCRACGHETDILHAIAGEVIVEAGVRLVGCVRTSCASCAGKAAAEVANETRRAPRGSTTCR